MPQFDAERWNGLFLLWKSASTSTFWRESCNSSARDRVLKIRRLVMTVHFRTVALSKGNNSEQLTELQRVRHSPGAYLFAVIVAVMSGLCAVAWILG